MTNSYGNNYILWIFLIFMVISHVCLIDRCIIHAKKNSKITILLKSLLFLLPIFLYWGLKLPLLYILLYVSYYLLFRYDKKELTLSCTFWANLLICVFVSTHLVCISIMSIIMDLPLTEICMDMQTWLFATICSIGIVNIIMLLFKYSKYENNMRILITYKERLRQLIHFELYAIVYLLFDSLSTIVYLPYKVIPIFLIGSCVLLMVQIAIFTIYTTRIVEKAHFEAEYYRIEGERSELVKKEMQLKKLVLIDALTGAYTRRYAMQILESMQDDVESITIANIDINGLKSVNDVFGHQIGDEYLTLVANEVNGRLRKEDILSRIGGDEFLIISRMEAEELENILTSINDELYEKVIGTFHPSFSFGIVTAKTPFDIKEVIGISDKRMYEYKSKFMKEEELK